MKKTINDELLAMHGSPASIQYRMLHGMENGIGEGKVIPSPCNVASVMIEQFATIGSGLVQDCVRAQLKHFPNQSSTVEDLYPFMSKFEYVGLYSTPSSTMLEMSILVSSLNTEAKEVVGKDYRKVVIPRYSSFIIKGYSFGIYYPIEIRLRTATSILPTSISVVYDNTNIHPLYPLTDNLIENQIISKAGQDILILRVPVFQFERTVSNYDVYPDAPFTKSIRLKDNFYAVRAYTNRTYAELSTLTLLDGTYTGEVYTDINGTTWTELGQSFENGFYDVSDAVIPSVVIQPDMQNQLVKVTIPQVFLTEKRIGDKLRIEVYSTSGEIEFAADISEPLDGLFLFDDTAKEYSSLLFNTENVAVFPLSATIAGGSNGLSFEELRNKVVYSNPNTQTIVSDPELRIAAAADNFEVLRFKDGLTKRILLMCKGLTLDNSAVLSGMIRTQLYIDQDYHGIIQHTDGSITITPQSLYEYDEVRNTCVPLSITHALVQPTVGANDVVTLNNDHLFTFTPFHVVVQRKNNVWLASSYNFNNPSFNWLSIVGDSDTTETVAILDGRIAHTGVDRAFILRLYVQDVDVEGDYTSALQMNLRIPTSNGSISLTSDEVVLADTEMYFEFTLGTEYHMSSTNLLQLISGVSGYVELKDTWEATLSSTVTYPDGTSNSVYATHQFEIELGTPLHTLFNVVDVTASAKTLVTYEQDEYARYQQPVYELFEESPGVWVPAKIEEGEVVMNKLHDIGDIIYTSQVSVYIDEDNIQQYTGSLCEDYKDGSDYIPLTEDPATMAIWGLPGYYDIQLPTKFHAKGDALLDAYGQPQYSDAKTELNIDLIQIGNKVKYQPRADQYMGESAVVAIRNQVIGNCTTVNNYLPRLIGNTELYYQPSKSLGSAECLIGNTHTVIFNLELSMRFKLHVERYVFNDKDKREAIFAKIASLIDEYLVDSAKCSMVDISHRLLSTFSGIIHHVDVLGINGDPSIQTVTPIDSDVRLTLAHRMVLGTDQVPTTERGLDIDFVVASNT